MKIPHLFLKVCSIMNIPIPLDPSLLLIETNIIIATHYNTHYRHTLTQVLSFKVVIYLSKLGTKDIQL